MDLRHKIVMISPNIKETKDEGTQKVFNQLSKQLYDLFKNVHDDLIRLRPEVVETLPTASAENYQRLYLKTNSGADDTLHVCIYDGAASDYKFQQVTLS